MITRAGLRIFQAKLRDHTGMIEVSWPGQPFLDRSINKGDLMLVAGTVVLGLIGLYAPASFMSHFIVFALACFVGFQVIWSVSHSLHTPLMAVTNAISGIVILGALLQVGSGHWLIVILSAISILIATINIVGGFLVTRRMLAMFQRS